MKYLHLVIIMTIAMQNCCASEHIGPDTIQTSKGNLVITFIGHASLMLQFNDLVFQIDPVMQEGDYTSLPKADIVLITHQHSDHLDAGAIDKTIKKDTRIFCTEKCLDELSYKGNAVVMHNGDIQKYSGITIEAVPAYNIKHMRSPGNPFHPRGEGNGYILTLGDKRIYIAGDTENTPEVKALTNIDIAFLPMNLPYTMTPEMVTDAAVAFKPKILYPYHFGSTDTGILVKLLKDFPEIEVRIRDMK